MTPRQATSSLSTKTWRYPVHDRAFPRSNRPVLVVDDTIEPPRDIATPEERDEAFGRILANRNLRRTHEMFLAEQTTT